jgi:hypothetical protein
MYFSRGDKKCWVVLTPYGQIRSTSKASPKDLIVQISNATIDLYATALDYEL